MQGQFLSTSEPRCDAFNLVSALAAYDLASMKLVESWLDMELCAEFGQLMVAIREHGIAVPVLTVPSLQLVIAHSELVCTMRQNSSVGVSPIKVEEVKARHTASIRALAAAAVKLLRND